MYKRQAYQWGFGNDASTLQTPGVSNAASANPPSWDEKGGNMDGKEVVVAVLDSGIDASHPDLDGSISVSYTHLQPSAPS